MKKVILSLMCLISLSSISALAVDKYGYVNFKQVMSSYNQAKKVQNTLKSKEDTMQKFIAENQAAISKASSPEEKKRLEEKAGTQIQKMISDIRAYSAKEIKTVEDNLEKAIQSVGKKHNYTLIFSDASVFYGAEDITNLVIDELNKK